MKTHVKVCGLTRTEDARLAMSYGAEALGFIFTESPRQLTISQAAALVSELYQTGSIAGSVIKVGVFKNPSLKTVLDTTQQVHLSAAQLHGQETPEFIAEIKNLRPDLMIIKSIGVSDQGVECDLQLYTDCDYLLFDSLAPRIGVERPLLAWKKLQEKLNYLDPARPFFVAGGLNSHNVGQLIQELHPYGVDVSSGIESHPGLKDRNKMKSFFESVNQQIEGRKNE